MYYSLRKAALPLALIILAAILCASCARTAAESPALPADQEAAIPPKSLEELLKSDDPKDWEAALAQNDKERQAIVTALEDRFKNEQEKPRARHSAAMLLAQTHTPEAAEFLLANTDVKVPLPGFKWGYTTMDDYPCVVAMFSKAGWDIVPATLTYLKSEHDKKELTRVANAVGNHTTGDKALLALLEVEYALPQNDIHQKNLRFVMDCLIQDLSDGDLTPEQLERSKLLKEGKIEEGQITHDNKQPDENPAPPAENK